MSFKRFEKDVLNISGLENKPRITAEELKGLFDKAGKDIKEFINFLIDAMEDVTGATNMGAETIDDNDNSLNNIQAKLIELALRIKAIKEGELNDKSIETSKLADGIITIEKIKHEYEILLAKKNGELQENLNAEKVGGKTVEQLDNAASISATKINEQDTSDSNVQAKLIKIANDILEISVGGVADNSIGSNKIIDGAVTTDKILNGNVTNEKIAEGTITESKLVAGYGLVPKGLISMWSGSVVPIGWALCDGTNGTPNLTDRFIVGAGNEYNIGDVGGEKEHVLSIAEMPSHSHTYQKTSATDDTSSNLLAGGYTEYISSVSSSSVSTGSKGSGEAHENRPPYYALAYIIKI